MAAPSSSEITDRQAAQRAYFVANGWPVNLDGTPVSLNNLDREQLHSLVLRYAGTLSAEFDMITPGRKREE